MKLYIMQFSPTSYYFWQ